MILKKGFSTVTRDEFWIAGQVELGNDLLKHLGRCDDLDLTLDHCERRVGRRGGGTEIIWKNLKPARIDQYLDLRNISRGHEKSNHKRQQRACPGDCGNELLAAAKGGRKATKIDDRGWRLAHVDCHCHAQAPAERIENDGLDRIRMGLPERNKVTRTNTTGLRGVWPGYG